MNKMHNILFGAVMAGAALAAVPAVAQQAQAAFGQPELLREELDGQLRTSSVQTTQLANTVALVTFGVTSEGSTAAEAASHNTELLTKVFDSLKTLGVEDKNMRTSNLNLSPVYGNNNRIQGYRMSNLVSVKVEDLDSLGRVMTSVVEAGVNEINQVSMIAPDDSEIRKELREKALQAARAEAADMADAAGAVITGIISIDYDTYRPMPMARGGMMMAMAESSPDMPVAAGESDVSETVSITWSIRMKDAPSAE